MDIIDKTSEVGLLTVRACARSGKASNNIINILYIILMSFNLHCYKLFSLYLKIINICLKYSIVNLCLQKSNNKDANVNEK